MNAIDLKMTIKDEVLSKISLVIDEPELENLEFNFREYANQLTNFLTKDSMPTPFVLAIHGEWGSGKTTLIKKTKFELDKKLKETGKTNWKTGI